MNKTPYGMAIAMLALAALGARAEEMKARIPLTVSYFGETATHPGAVIGTEWTLLGERDGNELIVGAAVGFYVHPRNNTGVFAKSELGWRLTSPAGFFFEVDAGAGYLHTFLGAPAYEVVDGKPVPYVSPGSPGFMPTVALGIGWNFGKGGSVPVSAFVKLGAFGQYPFNTYLLPHLNAEAGVRYVF